MIGDLLNYYLIFGTKWSTYNHSEPLTAIAINGTTVTYKSILDFGIELNGHIHIHVDIVGGCKPLQNVEVMGTQWPWINLLSATASSYTTRTRFS